MKITILSSDSELSLEIKDQLDNYWKDYISYLLDHAVLNKSDVMYQESEGVLTLKLRRNLFEKKRKKLFGLNLLVFDKHNTQKSILIIKDIENCIIRDEDRFNENEVILGGMSINGNEIYIGSFCEKENSYGITLKVKKLNIILEDIAE